MRIVDENPTSPATPASLSTRTHKRGPRVGFVRLAVVASVVSAVASLFTGTLAVSSYRESRALRAELAVALNYSADPPRMVAPAPEVASEESTEPLPPIDVHITRARIDAALADGSEMARQARIVPSFKGGKAEGFKLFSIKPGSLWQELGLQNGDVVMRVNGMDLSSPDKALEVYSRLKNTNYYVVDVLRRSRPLIIHVTIVD